MLNNKNTVLVNLHRLGLTADECKVYLALLEEPMSHLEVARKTGVNRTKVYRIADELTKRSLITEVMNDEGRELAANNPSNLEIVLTSEEQSIKSKRAILKQTLPTLKDVFENGDKPKDDDFVVNTYEGVSGFKQMLWNELSAEGENLVFADGAIQDLVDSQRWAEKHREKTLETNYYIREITNPNGKIADFTKNKEFLKRYQKRCIPKSVISIYQQIAIYNNTVSIYSWHNNKKVGTEIINKQFADMQRAIFENYWNIAK